MDTLALLCNLYGDGPPTLRRLRDAGCGTLAALEALESERLATLLRTSVRSAQRFQNEGRLLRERSEIGSERPAPRRMPEAPAEPRAPEPDPIVANVLSAWRAHDASSVGDATRPPRAASRSGTHGGPVVRVPAGSDALEALDGVDGPLLAQLREAGLSTLGDLHGADVLDLARRGGAGYTRLLHLQFLARRALERRPPSALPRRPAGGGGVGAAPAGGSLNEVPAGAAPLPSASPASGDVLVPTRPPERRRGGKGSAEALSDASPRFSPRAEPTGSDPLGLEADLEAFARQRDAPPAQGLEARAGEDAGSSGPFA